MKDDVYTINTTLKIQGSVLIELENYLKNNFELIDFKIVPNTEKLYNNDKTFKKLVKQIKELQRLKHDYIMKHNEI